MLAAMHRATIPMLLLGSLPLAAAEPPSIKVLGVAEERVPPDQISFRCEIRSTGPELAAVAAANRERAAAVTAMLRGRGLGEAELKTSSASFGEDVEFKEGRRVKLGYQASTSIVIVTGRLELYDTLWLELAKFPDLSVEEASFGLRDRGKARVAARAKALTAARIKAGEMAAVLDGRIGAPIRITENPETTGVFFNNPNRNSIDAVLAGGDRPAPLEPGLVEVVERVEAEFELLD